MDESLLSFSESRLRTIFGRWGGDESTGDAGSPPPAPAADPLYPSLDAEPPELPPRRGDRPEYQRPAWDPRDRWRQLRPSQLLYAPPESDLPAQFRYEDLSVYEKSETMQPEQDRLLAWLQGRFERGLQFKYSGQLAKVTADQAVRQQVMTPLQLLDEQLGNSLGLASADRALLERRRRLLAAAAASAEAPKVAVPTASTAASSKAAAASEGWEEEIDEAAAAEAVQEEFGQFARPQQPPQQQVVVTVHEAARKPHHRRQRQLEAGDQASESSTIEECELGFRRGGSQQLRRQQHQQQHQHQHPVAQFGDVQTISSCEEGAGGARKKLGAGSGGGLAEEAV